jgi:UDP-N-acetylmuramoyl-tripeptide--D-alanyl-D-alanine ligase
MAGHVVPLTAAGMAAAMGGRLAGGDPAGTPRGFSIDSRSMAAGDVFFAIVAARDGHAFAREALAKGAAGVVVSRSMPELAAGDRGPAVIEVADTTVALQALGRHVRRASGATVVAITGSTGKTTTKETVAALLGTGVRVVKNHGNLNNHLGLPLSLLELRHGADVGVMELGMNHAGEIRVLVDVAEPEIRVWTNVGEAHIGHFGSPDAIADAKAEILEGAGPASVFVGNADDARVMSRAQGFPGRTVTFGFGERADVRATAVENLGVDGMRARVTTPSGACVVATPLLGRGNLANVLCAMAVGFDRGVDLDAMSATVATLTPAPHRGTVRRLAKGVTVMDDSYNSSPSALDRAIEVLARETRGTRRVAVIGEMLELGDLSASLHARCGREAAAAGVDLLVTVGSAPAEALGKAAVEAGLPGASWRHFTTSPEAAEWLAGALAAGDVVLVKGSRLTRTDLVVDRLATVFG